MRLHFEGTGKNQVSQPGKFSYKSKYYMFDTNVFKNICAWKLWWANLKGRDNMDDLGVGGRIILKRIINKEDGRRGVDYSGSEQGKKGV